MTDLLTIRTARLTDLSELVEILNPYILQTSVTFDTKPYSVDSRRPWFNQFSEKGRHQCLVAELDGQVVAYANSAPLRPKAAYDTSVEVSIYKAKSCDIRGIGSKLYEALFNRLAKEDVHRAHALITLPNEVSIKLHEKFQFKPVGTLDQAGRKFGQYHSVYWMEKKLR